MSRGAVAGAWMREAQHPGARSSAPLPWRERVIEEAVGNRLGAAVYRTWVQQVGLAGDERVLEVGSGGGACSRHLVAALPYGRLTCVESDPRWFSVARPRLGDHAAQVEFVTGDITRWSRPGRFDVAITHFVLHDLSTRDREAALCNIAVSLEPTGCVCVREPLAHGMSGSQLIEALRAAGFERAGDPVISRVPLMGPTISGVWTL